MSWMVNAVVERNGERGLLVDTDHVIYSPAEALEFAAELHAKAGALMDLDLAERIPSGSEARELARLIADDARELELERRRMIQ
jgi:hypothetical protein